MQCKNQALNIDNVSDLAEVIIINSYVERIKTQNKKNDERCCETETDAEEV